VGISVNKQPYTHTVDPTRFRPAVHRQDSPLSLSCLIGFIESTVGMGTEMHIGSEMNCPYHTLSRRSAWLSWSRRSHGSAQHYTPRVRGHGGPVGGLGDGGYRRSGAKIRGVILYKVEFRFCSGSGPGRRCSGGLAGV
jgi:hypothetical protein